MGPASDMRFVNFLYESDCLVLRAPWTDFKFQTRVWKLCFCTFSSLIFGGEILVRFPKIHVRFLNNIDTQKNYNLMSERLTLWFERLSVSRVFLCIVAALLSLMQHRSHHPSSPQTVFDLKFIRILPIRTVWDLPSSPRVWSSKTDCPVNYSDTFHFNQINNASREALEGSKS